MSEFKMPKATTWTPKATLNARTTTTRGYLWFTKPINSCWEPLYTADALRDVLEQAAQKVVDEYGPTYDVVADKIRAMKEQIK